MCGINGIINFDQVPIDDEIYLMNSALKHRGPDGDGSYKYNNILLGHTRLAIQDTSDNGSQPMSNDGNYWIVYNGEIYNFKEIRDELLKKGYKFYSNTDTEVILNSYKEWGDQCFNKFNGMWSFAILDISKNEMIICRDRYGVKPCYFYNTNNKFIFSSEIKSILAITRDRLDANKILLKEQSKEGFFTTDYCNINILEPGHYFKINLTKRNIEPIRWWNGLNNIFEISPNRKNIIKKIKSLLEESIKKRLVSDVKISTSLSGGVDSSIIFNELDKIQDSMVDLNPFIVNYEGNLTYDFALNFAKAKNKKPVIVNNEERISLDKIHEVFSGLERKQFYSKQLDLYKAQRDNHYKVSIDGHGADECLGGYADNLKDFSIFFQNSLVSSYTSINNISQNNLDLILKKNFLQPINQLINLDLRQYLNYSINSEYVEVNKCLSPSKSFEKDLKELDYFDFGFQSLYLKSTYGFLQWLLNKWDRASMKNSVEIRSPFLDFNLFQYALSIPSYEKIRGGVNKSILREAYLNEIPNEIILFKNKQGLPVSKNSLYEKILYQNSANEKLFLESNLWDSKKILKDYNDTEIEPFKKKQIVNILETFHYGLAMDKSYERTISKQCHSFNLLS